jgi:formyl-CoA transferase
VFAVACGNDRQFARLADVVGRPGLAADPRFATNSARVANRRELITALERELAAAPASHWQRVLFAAGVPAGRVGDIGDGIQLAEEAGLDPLLDLGPDHVPQIRNPVRLDSPSAVACPPPGLGEHNELVRAWLADAAAPPLPHPSADTKAG